MERETMMNLPYMLYADREGRIFDHPYFTIVTRHDEDVGVRVNGDPAVSLATHGAPLDSRGVPTLVITARDARTHFVLGQDRGLRCS